MRKQSSKYRGWRQLKKDMEGGEKRQFLMTKFPPKDPIVLRGPHLKGIGLVRSETVRDGKTTEHVKFNIMNRVLPINKYVNAVRAQWGIENRLYWQLDVSFGE